MHILLYLYLLQCDGLHKNKYEGSQIQLYVQWKQNGFINEAVTTVSDFIKKVLSVYTHSTTTIYLSLSAQVANSTFFMKSPVLK